MIGFVIDASVLTSWFLGEERDQTVELAVDSLADGKGRAPSLFFFEIRNALIVNERRGRLSEDQSRQFLEQLGRMNIRLEPPGEEFPLMSIARRRRLTVYDAAYLELAKREGLPLATLDRDLERAALAEGVALFQG